MVEDINFIDNLYNYDYRFFYTLSRVKDFKIKSQLLVVFNFYFELMAIKKKVTNDMIALIRYQWWHDNIIEIFEEGKVKQHPGLEMIQNFKTQNPNIKEEYFVNTITSFEKINEDFVVNNIEELDDFLNNKFRSLFKLPAIIYNAKLNDKIINNAAICFGLHEMIVNIEYYINHKQNLLPQLLIKNIENAEKNHHNLYKLLLKPLIDEFYKSYQALAEEFNLLSIQKRKNLIVIFLPLIFCKKDIDGYVKSFPKILNKVKDYRKLGYQIKNFKTLMKNKIL